MLHNLAYMAIAIVHFQRTIISHLDRDHLAAAREIMFAIAYLSLALGSG